MDAEEIATWAGCYHYPYLQLFDEDGKLCGQIKHGESSWQQILASQERLDRVVARVKRWQERLEQENER